MPENIMRPVFIIIGTASLFSVLYFAFYMAANAGWFAHVEWLDRLAG